MSLAAALDAVLATFRGVVLADGRQLRASDDSAQINPPCVWVPVPAITYQFGKRVLDVTWQAYLIAPNQNTGSVSSTLSQLVDAVAGVFPFTDGAPTPLVLQGGGQPVPSYQLTWSSRIPIGD